LLDYIGEIGAVTHQGDSGGAIMYKDEDDINYLVGVTSYIEKDDNTFIGSKGSIGSTTGHFVNFVNYDDFFSVFNKYFYR
jgi:hypothetical protein